MWWILKKCFSIFCSILQLFLQINLNLYYSKFEIFHWLDLPQKPDLSPVFWPWKCDESEKALYIFSPDTILNIYSTLKDRENYKQSARYCHLWPRRWGASLRISQSLKSLNRSPISSQNGTPLFQLVNKTLQSRIFGSFWSSAKANAKFIILRRWPPVWSWRLCCISSSSRWDHLFCFPYFVSSLGL